GDWALVRTNLRGSGDKEQWLLIKERDQAARNADDYDIVTEQPQSVISGTLVGGAQRKEDVGKKTSAAKKIAEEAQKKSPSVKEKIPTTKKPGIKSTKPTVNSGASVPEQVSPELATLVNEPPAGDWLYEIKFD